MSGDAVEPGHITPEALKVVVIARLIGEYVNNQEAIVHQDPTEGVPAFDPERLWPPSPDQRLFDPIDDRPHLTVVTARRHNEPVGDGEDSTHIEGIGTLTQLFFSCFTGYPYPGDELCVFDRSMLLWLFRWLGR